jgi:hypothetical protein
MLAYFTCLMAKTSPKNSCSHHLQLTYFLDVLFTVHHGTLMNQHQLDTLFLVCLLGVNTSTCFRRYSPIFRRLCTVAIWCNCVRRMFVDCVQLAENRNLHTFNTHPTRAITPNSICAEPPEDGQVTPETCRGIDS